MKTFEFRLKADVSYLEEQFKGGAKQLAALAQQADKAEDKLKVLQETGNYITQIDIALAKVKKKYPNLFQEIFGNVNKQINEALSPLGKMPKEMEKIFGKTKVKLDTLIAKPTAATASDIQEIGNAFKLLAKTMGDKSLDFSFLDGASKNETKIKKLTAAMKELEQSYFNVGAAASVTGGEVKTPKIKTPKPKKNSDGSGGYVGNVPSPVNDDPRKVDSLVNSYLKLFQAITKVNSGLISMEKQDEIIKKLLQDLNLSKDEFENLHQMLDMSGTDDTIDGVFKKIEKAYGTQLPEIKVAFNDIVDGVQQYIDIQNQLANAKTDEELEELKAELDIISDSFINLSKISKDVFNALRSGLSKDDAIKQLADIFKVQLPQAAISGAQQINDAYKQVEQTVKRASNVIKEVLADTSDLEKFLYINTKNKTSSDYISGLKDGIPNKSREELLTNFGGSEMFDSTLHTHPSKIAAPSGEKEDIDIFIKNLEKFKKNFILAGEQLAEIDFSSLSKEQVQNIRDKFVEKSNDIDPFDHDDMLINDLTTLTSDSYSKIVDLMTSNLEASLPQKNREQIGDDNLISEITQSYINKVGDFLKTTDIGSLPHTDLVDEFDKIAIDLLSQYPDNIRKNLKNTLSGGASSAFDDITGVQNVLFDKMQQDLQDAFIASITESGLDASKIFKLYNVKDFDFDTFTPKQTSGKLDNTTGSLEKEKQLTKELMDLREKLNSIPSNPVDAAELDDAKRRIEELQKEILTLEGAANAWKASYYDAQEALDNSISMHDVEENMTSNDIVDELREKIKQLSDEIIQLNEKLINTQAGFTQLDSEIDEALAQETGDLESKLERLRDIAEEFGRDINKRKRNSLESLIDKDNEGDLTDSQQERLSDLQEEIDEADAALEEFGETYDKIILKLADGKKVTILPDDKGLRDLYKFMDEGYGQDFKGVEIDDIEFIRKAAVATEEATNDANELRGALEGAAGETRDLKAEAEAARKAFEMLAAEINSDLFAGRYDEFSLGKSQAELDEMQTKLQELADKGYIAADAMYEINTAYQETRGKISASYEGIRNENMYKEDAGSYDSGYNAGYLEAEKRYEQNYDYYLRENNEFRQTIESLEKELREAQQKAAATGGQIGTAFDEEAGAVKSNIQAEIDQLEELKQKLIEIEQAVDNKTAAFDDEKASVISDVGAEIGKLEELKKEFGEIVAAINSKTEAFKSEGITVDAVITSEIAALDRLIAKLNEVKSAVDAKSDAFKQEENAVKDSVKKATRKKKETDSKKQELADDSGKDADVNKRDAKAAEEKAAAEKKANDELQKQAELKDKLLKQQGTLNHLEKQAKAAEKVAGNTFTDAQAEQYEQLLVSIREYKKSKEVLSEEELAYIRETVVGYQQQAKAINEAKAAEEKRAKEAKAAEDKFKNAFGRKEITNATNRMDDAEAYGRQFKGSDVVQNQLETVRQLYAQLKIEQEKLANSTEVVTQEQENAFKDLVNTFGREYGKLKTIISDSEKTIKNSRFNVDVDPSVASNMNMLKEAMENAINSSEKGKVRIGKFNAELGTMEYQVKEASGQWSNFTAQLDASRTKIVGVQSGIKKTNTFLKDMVDSTLSKMKSAIGNITGYDLIYRVINEVKRGITYVREIDSAMTELRKVTNETEETYAKFLQTASKTADRIGSTIKDVTTMTADWSRLGYSLKEASALAESTGVLLNVSEFSDATQASEALISTIQAYGYAADESMQVVDVLNEVGNNFAVSSDGLATALQTSASALMSAGNDLNQSVALVAAANKVIQDPSQVGRFCQL